MKKLGQSGFTLLEVLISVAIFSLVSAAMFSMLQLTLKSSKSFEDKTNYLVELQRAQHLLQQDFSQVIARSIRDEFGDRLAAVLSDDSHWAPAIELTRTGHPNPLSKPRSDLIRLRYLLDGENLIRRTWKRLDRVPGVKYFDQIVLSNVKSWQVRFLQGKEWVDSWPPDNAVEDKMTMIPTAFEVKLILDNEREFRWLFTSYPKILDS
ncbi:MAG: type II secretion system minor pseudopilin GspJ [Piscirickettsiaceae bacterium]|nr:type II secretion system minor pseudopilin GspJ [Piscirickettsiaceae bacterium]